MSDEKSKVTDKASEIAKNIWLAGVGAYGRAVDEAQSSLKKATPQPPKLFRDLVKAGTALEEEASEARSAAISSVEERISQVRENFHQQRPARIEDLASLHDKIDKLTRKVDTLTRLVKAQDGAAGAKAKKPAAKAGASTRKAAARKKTSAGSTRKKKT
ncbi:phasin family protein [Pseudohalioglobus sediminis]|uniref:Phasin family protein n=1 Tax=Pseudohalioglobus sediminis TaxID=2606449 RepID=A0A5B0WUF1_9GAMM|nr:phasin family protein [Pseudohalioglobus sediminis]KAA1189925.1 phasin family protein [Pseudohalioglobus sediminis]